MILNTERFEWVDYAKAIGILLVVYGHVARGLVTAGIMDDTVLYQYIDSIIYSFHMPLFFFLSGLFLTTSFQTKGFSRVLSSKIDTIFYPYVLWSLLQGGVEVVLSAHTNGNITTGEVLSLLTSPRAQFWFLYALFLVFLISLAGLYFTGVKALPVLFILSIALYLWMPSFHFITDFYYISGNLVFFMLGAVFQQLRLIRFNSGIVLCVFSLVAIIGQYLFHSSGFTYTNKGIFLLALSTISLLTIVSFSKWLSQFKLSFVAYVGVSSMAIYLMHVLAGSGVRVILNKVFDIDSLMIHLLLGTLMGMLLPLIALKIINYFKFPYAFSLPISRVWTKR
jgi:fucose 4-O-acetylase-like acetyltransferase